MSESRDWKTFDFYMAEKKAKHKTDANDIDMVEDEVGFWDSIPRDDHGRFTEKAVTGQDGVEESGSDHG